MTTVQEQWEGFERCVVQKNAPNEQRKEMRLAFFAGVSAILAAQLALPDDEGAAMDTLKAWHDECQKFATDYARNAQ